MDTTDQPAPDAILDAAEELFAGQGFKATTIKQIGAAAGVNPALIYYYFESKEKLYHALLHRLFGRIMEQAGSGLDRAASAAEAVRLIIGTQSVVMQARPSLPRLLVRELADHQAAHAAADISQLAATVFRRLCDLIEAGQRDGTFRGDLDPRFTAISAISLLPFFHIARPAVGILLGHGTEGPTGEEMQAYGRHAAEFVVSALRPPGEETGGS
jgi:TetR/AcrR family transcriptional regulator